MTQTIYKKIVLQIFDRMKKGRLDFSIVGGENYHFGQGDEIIADLRVNDKRFFKRLVLYGEIGLGEAYMDGIWETSDLTKIISFLIMNMAHVPKTSLSARLTNPTNFLKIINRFGRLLKPNTLKGAKKNIAAHYDLSNDFYKTFLDPSMTYSCALFTNDNHSLEQAQQEKFDSLCHSIKLNSGDHVLEIGCGWGGFAVYAAKKYGCKITGITISTEQYNYALQRVKDAGLEKQIDIRFEDYRKVTGKFDKVVSIEMIEAVGHKYFGSYFGKINSVLKKNGVLGLQAIITPDSHYERYRKDVGWIQKHIFPGGLLPSIGIINHTINKTGNLNLYALKEMGLSYAKTLKNWYENFEANLTDIKILGFSDRFIRKWEYYLCSCEASFLQRDINVVQMVYARPNNPDF